MLRYQESLNSLQSQKYSNFKLYIIADNSLENGFEELFKGFEWCIITELREIGEEYIVPMELEDILDENSLAHIVEGINQNGEQDIIYSDYDNFDIVGEYHTEIRKSYIPKDRLTLNIIKRGLWVVKNKHLELTIDEIIMEIISNSEDYEILHINEVLMHRRIVNRKEEDVIKCLAYYLPQFHTFPENDRWWGKGFTEWTNVRRALPMFEGHQQPRVPGKEIGYYDLAYSEGIQAKQIELAKAYGLYGFCYYYYWFNGKRLMEKPLDNLLADKKLDFPFCICWANENWTRRWDGLEAEILIAQNHEQDSDERFIGDIIEMLADERYIKINGKPLLIIYKAYLLENPKMTIATWREEARKYGYEDLYIGIVTHLNVNQNDYGADAIVEFPPNGVEQPQVINHLMQNLNPNFGGNVLDYAELANRVDTAVYKKPIFRGCTLKWDNTPRRRERSTIFDNFSPEDYRRWLLKIKEYEMLHNVRDERFIFINAWNEWAEGAHLEPDSTYGKLFLEITKDIIENT